MNALERLKEMLELLKPWLPPVIMFPPPKPSQWELSK